MKRYQRVLWIVLLTIWSSCSQADYLEVQLLGTGTPQPNIERFGAATLVQAAGRYYLFDAGRGATIRLQQAGVLPSQIEQVFLTHLHSDHISGLVDLWLTGWVWQRPVPMDLFGPKGTANLAEHLMLAHTDDVKFRSENTGLHTALAKITAHEINEGVVYQDHSVTISAFLVDHRPVEPAFGYRIDFGDRSVVISGDTTFTPNLVTHAKGCDVLIHEIVMAKPEFIQGNEKLQHVISYHSTPEQVADVFNQVKPRLGALTHVLTFGVDDDQLRDAVAAHYDGRFVLGSDLMKLEVGDRIQIRTPN